MDPTRWALLAMGVITVVVLVVAVAMWANDDYESTLLAVETHELTQDQAACLRFGLIERRFDATVPVRQGGGASTFRGGSTLRPGLQQALDNEITAIDAIASSYPEADYRIINAFADVGDESAALLSGNGTYINSVSEALDFRKETGGTARDVCLEVAGFDTIDMAPTD